ncbi:MAG: lytic transglycosylase domain-containing protein [Bdellovibrionales bacterium]|nr:lytic transglycosylase domain-containing protein [Bdellovibrionales bacterium]
MALARKSNSATVPRRSRPAYSAVGPHAHPGVYLANLGRRIQKKKAVGKPLSAVEAYYAHRPHYLERSLRGPGLATATLQIILTCLRPLPLLAMVALIVLAEASTSALFTGDRLEDRNNRLLELAVATPSAPSTDAPPTLDFDFPTSAAFAAEASPVATVQSTGLVEFITGLIAVYRPFEADAGQLARQIVEASHRHQIDPLYVASVIAMESSFRSKALSHVGATGLMQVMPGTAKEVHQRHLGRAGRPQLTDPATNIDLGISYLKRLEEQYRNRDLALQAYNWGPANVDKARRGQKRTPQSVRNYSRKILERTLRWNKHLDRATRHAAELSQLLDTNV